MEPYGIRLRKRIIELYDQDKSTAEIARLLGTCESGTRRVRQHFQERGTLEPRTGGGGRPGLDESQQNQLRQLVKQQPDATLAELQTGMKQTSGLSLAICTVDRWCAKLDLRFKKSRSGPRSRIAPTSGPHERSGMKR
jgi:transposase